MPYENKEQAAFMKREGVFLKESNFFKIIPELTKNYDIERWSPLCYLAKEDVIVLEDLRLKNYKMHDNLCDNTNALKSGLSSLAAFHSCSILTEARLNENTQKKKTLDEFYPNNFAEQVFRKEGSGPRWFSVGADVTAGLAKKLGYNPTKVYDAYKKLFDIVKPSDKYCNVICHGDLWGNNLMFDDSSPQPKCILVDFQILRYGPLVTDLLQFLHLNARREFRDKYEVDLIEFYYNKLKKNVSDNDSTKSAEIPSLEEILKGVDELRVYGLVHANLYIPFALLDQKVVAECTKDSVSYNRFVFENRLDVALAYMKDNEHYKIRIEEAVIELIEKFDG